MIRGFLWMTVAALAAAMSFFFVKLASAQIAMAPLIFYYYAISTLFLVPFFLIKPKGMFVWRRPWLHFFRLAAGIGVMVSAFLAIRTLSLTNYLLLYNTGPLWVPVLGWLFLGTRVSFRLLMGLLAGFFGVALVLMPSFALFNLGTIFGLSAGICCSLVLLIMKGLSRKNSTPAISLTYVALASLIALPFAYKSLVIRDPLIWLYLVGAGACLALMQIATVEGLKRGPTSILSVCYFITILFSALLDFFIWKHIPGWQSIVGAVFILSSVTWCIMQRSDEQMV